MIPTIVKVRQVATLENTFTSAYKNWALSTLRDVSYGTTVI
jgi:hypothetical protein